MKMQALNFLRDTQLEQVTHLLFDVDETLTSHGLLTQEAYAALFALRAAGIEAVPVTGRPSGWGNFMLASWPIKACVTENGGVISWKATNGALVQEVMHSEQRGEGYIEKLRALGARIVAAYPSIKISNDQPYRLTDLAIDYAEQVPRAAPEIVRGIELMMRAEGYLTVVSSIHIHAYSPANEKSDGVYPLMLKAFAMDREAVWQRCVFVGDSPNDASLFKDIPRSVGVANVRGSLVKMDTAPAFVTEAECGAGFAELVDFLIHAKRNKAS